MKYPRISHTEHSCPSDDDVISHDQIFPKSWLVTEKVDGSQLSISFENWVLTVYNRGTLLLRGNMDRQYHTFPHWIYPKISLLMNVLQEEYILFGEWLFHTHTVVYDQLPDWFLAFDIWNKRAHQFIPFDDMCKLTQQMGLVHVPILYNGFVERESDLLAFITTSHFGSEQMEGVVLHSIDGHQHYKFVTERFRSAIDTSPLHWRYKNRRKNKLKNALVA